ALAIGFATAVAASLAWAGDHIEAIGISFGIHVPPLTGWPRGALGNAGHRLAEESFVLRAASCIRRNANSFITFLSGKLSNVKTWLARNLARLAFHKGRFGGSALRRARGAAWPRRQAPILPLPSTLALPRGPTGKSA